MLEILRSDSTGQNKKLPEKKRKRGETNLQWLQRCWGDSDADDARLLLVGGTSNVSLRLRFAQSHARSKLTPSLWSHVMIVGKRARSLAKTPIQEISLEPTTEFGSPPATNALQSGTLADYGKATAYPNLALLRLPGVSNAKVSKICKRFGKERTSLDAVGLLLQWLAYTWGARGAGNPLLEGQGMPAAAMVEYVINAADYELTPGLASRSSCPEAIWQSARFWHTFYDKADMQCPTGAWTVEHYIR